MSEREDRLSRQRNDLKKKLAKANDQIEDLESENRKLLCYFEEYQRLLSEMNRDQETLEDSFKSLQAENFQLESKIIEIENNHLIQLNKLESSVKDLDRMRSIHMEQLIDKDKKIACLTQKIEGLKEDYDEMCSKTDQHDLLVMKFDELTRKYESLISERSTAHTYPEESDSELDTSTETVIAQFSHVTIDASSQTEFEVSNSDSLMLSENSAVNDSGVHVDHQSIISQADVNEIEMQVTHFQFVMKDFLNCKTV